MILCTHVVKILLLVRSAKQSRLKEESQFRPTKLLPHLAASEQSALTS